MKGTKRGVGAWTRLEKERREGTLQTYWPWDQIMFCPFPCALTVCFPERVPRSAGLPGAHTGVSSEHPFPSWDTVEFQILETSLLCPEQFFVLVNFSLLEHFSGFPFARFNSGKVSSLWLNSQLAVGEGLCFDPPPHYTFIPSEEDWKLLKFLTSNLTFPSRAGY